MQIFTRVIQRVTVNVVDDFTRLRASDSAVLPMLSVRRLGAWRPQALCIKRLSVRAVSSLCARRGSRCFAHSHRRHQLIAASQMLSGREAAHLLLVCIQWIAVAMPHLVVTHAHFTGGDGAVAVEAMPPDLFSSPAVLSGTMLFHSLVVHQTEAVGSMFSVASINSTCAHVNSKVGLPAFYLYKALGNSWAINCARWVGERIDAVDRIVG